MSRIRVTIDHVVLKGLDAGARNALLQGLQSQLSHVLADSRTRPEWAVPHRTPVLKLGRMPLEPGPSGSRKFGARLGGAIGKGLRP
ncbi:MAG TPA: hypothetical protein VGH38_03225 [Bryobacteraceae bacterium]